MNKTSVYNALITMCVLGLILCISVIDAHIWAFCPATVCIILGSFIVDEKNELIDIRCMADMDRPE